MNNFDFDVPSFEDNNKSSNFIQKASKSTKWALSNIFVIEAIIVIVASLLLSLVNLKLGWDNGVKPISTVFRSTLLLVCSYLMYLIFLAWGTNKGKSTVDYKEAIKEYNEHKKVVLSQDYTKLAQYCMWFVKDELKNTRISILSEIGLKYEAYESTFLGKTDEEIDNLAYLTETKKTVIKSANAVKPTTLTPSMIMTSGETTSRNLIGKSVEKMLKKDKLIKVITSVLLSFVIGSVFIDQIQVLSGWSVFIACIINLLPVLLNIFMGGYLGFRAYAFLEVENLKGKTIHLTNCEKFMPNEEETDNEFKID